MKLNKQVVKDKILAVTQHPIFNKQLIANKFWEVVQKHLPFVYYLFMRIAEPRVLRIIQFLIYISMGVSGVGIIVSPPTSFENVVGLSLVYVFGFFVALGSILGAIAVLPGIWWLERTGILALSTGIAIYLVLLISLGASIAGMSISIALILTFRQRWSEIKGADLAPRVPKKEE